MPDPQGLSNFSQVDKEQTFLVVRLLVVDDP